MSTFEGSHAEVLTESGVRFSARVANLATTGLFLYTRETLVFGQRLSLRLLDVAVRGEVLFHSAKPQGVVVGIRAAPGALATLEAHRERFDVVHARGSEPVTEELSAQDVHRAARDLEVELQQSIEVSDTPSNAAELVDTPALGIDAVLAIYAADGAQADDAQADDAEPPPPMYAADTAINVDIALVDSVASETSMAIDPALVAAAAIDDDESIYGEVMSPLEGPVTASDIPVLDSVEESMARPSLTETLPADHSVSDATPPLEAPGPEDLRLPTLESDGHTVRFRSIETYKEQFSSHIVHGGLVVRAEPLPIGTQRMLSLVVPGAGTYALSARVIFHTVGKLGFMVDSFSVHRGRLTAMAEMN
ncbi:MAG: hypothetical protein AAFN74_02550 [Myxococcota bacterium]